MIRYLSPCLSFQRDRKIYFFTFVPPLLCTGVRGRMGQRWRYGFSCPRFPLVNKSNHSYLLFLYRHRSVYWTHCLEAEYQFHAAHERYLLSLPLWDGLFNFRPVVRAWNTEKRDDSGQKKRASCGKVQRVLHISSFT